MKKLIIILSLTVAIGLIGCSKTKTNEEEQTAEKSTPIDVGVEKKAVNDAVVIQVQPDSDTLKGSLKAVATGKIGSTVITINYYSPAVRGRVIWGGLVPMDQVWVTGAHKATSIEFEGPIKIGGVDLPAGKYGLFTIPSKDEWIIIINKNWDQHLADEYDQKDDIIRIKVKPEIEDTNQERLRYVIEQGVNNNGEIVIYWEKLEVSLPVQF